MISYAYVITGSWVTQGRYGAQTVTTNSMSGKIDIAPGSTAREAYLAILQDFADQRELPVDKLAVVFFWLAPNDLT